MAMSSYNYGKCLPMNIVKHSIPKAKVSCQVMLSLLSQVAVSAITRRSICHGGIGDTAITHSKYYDDP